VLYESRAAAPDGALLEANSLTVRRHCAPGLVAGRYQPLADDVTIAGDVRPNLSSAVNQKTKEIGLGSNPISSAFGEGKALHFCVRRRPPPNPLHLLPKIDGLCPRFPGSRFGRK
jgi:hypothetical protein